MTSSPYGHTTFRNGLINQAGNKKRTSDELPPDIGNYVPLAESGSRAYDFISGPPGPSYWQQIGTQLGKHLLQSGIQLLRRLLSWRPRDLLSIPLALIILWYIALWWGEEAVFRRKVAGCAWKGWENWVSSSDVVQRSTFYMTCPELIAL